MYRVGICDDGHQVCSYIESSIKQYAEEKEEQIGLKDKVDKLRGSIC